MVEVDRPVVVAGRGGVSGHAESGAGLDRALSACDLRHNFSAVYRYTLPLERLAPNRPRLAGGWQVSGLTRFSTGLPVTLVNNNDTSLLDTAPNGINNNGIDEPAFVGGDRQIHHRPDTPAFNTALRCRRWVRWAMRGGGSSMGRVRTTPTLP